MKPSPGFLRGVSATMGALLSLLALPLLACGAYGLWLIVTPQPPGPPRNLPQSFDGMLLVMYLGAPGLVLGSIGSFLLLRARKGALPPGA